MEDARKLGERNWRKAARIGTAGRSFWRRPWLKRGCYANYDEADDDNTMKAAITYRINQELKFLYKEKQTFTCPYHLHLHCINYWATTWGEGGKKTCRWPQQVAKTCRRLHWLYYDKFTYLYMHLLVISHKKSSVHSHESFEIKKKYI